MQAPIARIRDGSGTRELRALPPSADGAPRPSIVFFAGGEHPREDDGSGNPGERKRGRVL